MCVYSINGCLCARTCVCVCERVCVHDNTNLGTGAKLKLCAWVSENNLTCSMVFSIFMCSGAVLVEGVSASSCRSK